MSIEAEGVLLEPQCGNGTLPKPSQKSEFVAASSFFFYFSFVVMAVCLIPWFLFKNKYERTQFRSTTLVLVLTLALLDDMMFFHLAPLIGNWLPCIPIAFLIVVVVPLLFGPIITRLLILLVLTRFSEDAATVNDQRKGFDTIDDSLELDQGKIRIRTVLPAMRVALKALTSSTKVASESSNDHLNRLSAFRFWSSGYGLVTIMGLLLLPFLLLAIIVIVSQRSLLTCYRCDRIITLAAFGILALSILLIAFGTFIYSHVRRFHDAWGLRRECQLSLIAASCAILFFFLGIFVRSVAGRDFEEGTFRFAYLITISIWFALAINTLVQLYLARRAHFKHAIPHRTTSMAGLDLDVVLNNKELCDAFEQHLVHEFGIESLMFLKDVDAWKRAFFDIAPNARKVRAHKIYSTYIALDGLFPVNVPWHMATDIKRLVNAKEDIQATVFDSAESEIRGLLTVGALNRFLSSRGSSLSAASLGVPHNSNNKQAHAPNHESVASVRL